MTEWIVPCNLKYYDVKGAFEKLKKIDWKQSNEKIEVNDIVYIYVGVPVKAIVYKCRVNKVNLSAVEIDDSEFIIDGTNYKTYSRHMELELIKIYNNNVLSLENMRDYGVKGNIQCTRRAESKLSAYIETL
ncbi:MAG: hypothetical protein NC177_06765 [Ruminococcus flavefaciens]|nr:hypothetical protein [Ruminococcus flavefaciens]